MKKLILANFAAHTSESSTVNANVWDRREDKNYKTERRYYGRHKRALFKCNDDLETKSMENGDKYGC